MPICNFKRTKTHDKRTRAIKLGVEQSAPFLTKINQESNQGGGNMKFMMNGIEWNVYKVPAYSDMLRRSDNSYTVGMCDFQKRSIFLCDKLKGKFLRKVFIHEVCHSAVFSYGIELDIMQEEFLCDFIATYGDEIFEVVDDMFAILKKAYIA